MADPDHIPQMDGLDVCSVFCYRVGLSAIAVGLVVTAWLELSTTVGDPTFGWVLVAAGTVLATANVHLYAKLIRWILHMATGSGLLLFLLAVMLPPPFDGVTFSAGLGLLFVSVCGFAFKEQFCFGLHGMWLLPLLLGIALLLWSSDYSQVVALATGSAGLLYGYLALAKWRMPVHFDIGDKSKYQL